MSDLLQVCQRSAIDLPWVCYLSANGMPSVCHGSAIGLWSTLDYEQEPVLVTELSTSFIDAIAVHRNPTQPNPTNAGGPWGLRYREETLEHPAGRWGPWGTCVCVCCVCVVCWGEPWGPWGALGGPGAPWGGPWVVCGTPGGTMCGS